MFKKTKKLKKKFYLDDTNIDYSPTLSNFKQKINQIISKPLTLKVIIFF